jgi:hypothetical protein
MPLVALTEQRCVAPPYVFFRTPGTHNCFSTMLTLGLFGRGLQTKIIANGMQGLMFSVLWKLIDEKMFKKEDTTRSR